MNDPAAGGSPERLWAPAGAEPTHPVLAALSHTLSQDLPLADADLRASAAWARALGRCGLLDAAEASRISGALDEIRADLAAGRWMPREAEDVHAAIEAETIRRVGEAGRRLHTGRSRNDQVATAFRMATRDRAQSLLRGLSGLQRCLLQRAGEEIDTLLPAYTHLQRAQPVRLAHWLMAHFWPLERDHERITAARDRAMVLPLGSAAGTGSSAPVDRAWLASELGFRAASDNSLDAVGDRDFAVELAFDCALVALHLSRLAEELVIWSSAEFGFVSWPDSLATGSSLMPNKRNPDLAELVRGRAASAIGHTIALMVLIKGLPASYHRDLQEDKPPVWRITSGVQLSLEASAAAVQAIRFDRDRMLASLSDDMLATEAADALVARGVPFRSAHAVVAQAMGQARRIGSGLRDLGAAAGEPLPEPLTREILAGLDFESAVERRGVLGGTARDAVVAQIQKGRTLVSGRP